MNYCYLHYKVFPEFVRAALLITDIRTKPVEFRITAKVYLEELQKIIYGESLKNALFVEKIGVEILGSAQSDFDVIIVKDRELFNLREHFKKPILLFDRYDEFRGVDRYSVKLQSQNPKFNPVLAKFTPQDEEASKKAIRQIQETFRYHNIVEPFERIERAIDFLNQREDDV